MKTILLFDKRYWNVLTVKNYLVGMGEKYGIRFGFSHILAILNETDEELLPNSEKEILCIQYDKNAEAAKNDILTIQGQCRVVQSLSYIAQKPNNIIFDLRNFGFYPESEKNLAEVYDDVVFDGNPSIFEPYQCRDLIENTQIDKEVKKYLLDIYIFIATGIQSLATLQDRTNVLKQYSGILLNIFITGAKMEELIFLVAKLDCSYEYYEKLKKAKKARSAFLNNSNNTKFKIAEKLRKMAGDYELFSEGFRTPEAHKIGRIFPLLTGGHYGTLVNEVLSFNNSLNALFGEIIAYLKSQKIKNHDIKHYYYS